MTSTYSPKKFFAKTKATATDATGTTSSPARNSFIKGHESIVQDSSVVKIVVIGATGAGKSRFIHLLTNDDKIQIGHDLASQTLDVQTAYYTDAATGCSVMLIDTPGFDNSLNGVSDVHILQKIITFLTPKGGESRKLNGIIYMHHINDPHRASRTLKYFNIFKTLCGDENTGHVRLVTTHWDDADEQDCTLNEGGLKEGAFQSLLAAGAQMHRHTNTVESARAIVSELIPLPKISTQLQVEVAKGTPIGETDAGRIINDDIEKLKLKHAEDLASLKKQIEETEAREEALIANLDAKRKVLEEKLARAEEDQEWLKMTIEELRKQQEIEVEATESWRAAFAEESAKLKKHHERALEEARHLREQVELTEKQRQEDVAEQQRRWDEGHVATARWEERRQDEMARLVDAERKVAELQRRIEGVEAAKQTLEGYGPGPLTGRNFIGTMIVIYVVGCFVALHLLGYLNLS